MNKRPHSRRFEELKQEFFAEGRRLDEAGDPAADCWICGQRVIVHIVGGDTWRGILSMYRDRWITLTHVEYVDEHGITGTAAELATLLRSCGYNARRNTITQWGKRGLVHMVGNDEDGAPVYRLADTGHCHR